VTRVAGLPRARHRAGVVGIGVAGAVVCVVDVLLGGLDVYVFWLFAL
jgi:hypothetical protein